MQEQLELLKEQVASLEASVNNSDPNLVYQNINAIKNSIANIEKNSIITKSGNLSNIVIKDKKSLKQSTVKMRVINRLKSIKRFSLTNLKLLKGKLNLLKSNMQMAKLKVENKVLEKNIDTINMVQNKKHTLQSKEHLKKQVIEKKESKKIHSLKHASKTTLNLFKQQLSVRSNTVGFKNILQKAQIGSLKVRNSALEGLNNAKEKGSQAKANFIDKKNLLKENIKLRTINAKNKIKNLAANQVSAIKNKAKDYYLSVTTNVGVKAIDAYENAKDKIDYSKTAVAVTALDMKDKIIDKTILMQDRIKRKFSSGKNIIMRKTGMQIALFKQDVKNKIKENTEKYKINQEMITELKEQRSALVEQFLSSPLEQARVR